LPSSPPLQRMIIRQRWMWGTYSAHSKPSVMPLPRLIPVSVMITISMRMWYVVATPASIAVMALIMVVVIIWATPVAAIATVILTMLMLAAHVSSLATDIIAERARDFFSFMVREIEGSVQAEPTEAQRSEEE
jgi:hypothetical protein